MTLRLLSVSATLIFSSLFVTLRAQDVDQLAAHLARARADLRSNTLDAAIAELQQAVALDPRNAEAHLELGSIAFLRNDYTTAERELRQSLDTTPDQPRAKALVALCEKRLHESSAEADLETAFTDTKEPRLRKQVGTELADSYYQSRQLDKTAAVMQTLVSLDPDNVDLLFFAQRVYSELADATLGKLALLAPGSARIEQLIAERLINAGDAPDAIVHYRKALAMQPTLPGVHFELAEAIMQSANNDPAALKETESELAAAIRVDGDSPQIQDVLGQISLQNANSAQALEHFQHAYAMAPADPGAAMGIAGVLKRNDKPQEALTYLRQAVKDDPMSVEAHYQLSQVYRDLKMPDDARQEMQLYHAVKDAKDKAKGLMREMNPHSTGQAEATAKTSHQ